MEELIGGGRMIYRERESVRERERKLFGGCNIKCLGFGFKVTPNP